MAINATASKAHAFLEAQRLQPTPPNYHLAYMHVTNAAPALSVEIARITDGGVRLRQDEAAELIARYGVAPATPAVAPTPANDKDSSAAAELHEALLRIAQIATDTGKASGEFGADLHARLSELQRNPEATAGIILSMIERADATERKLASVRGKVDELRQELESTKDDAFRDSLTDLPNRRAIERHLAGHAGLRSIAICDIDHFKSVNDRFGHQIGDRVLKMVAQSLSESCHGHFVARWGGEEFLVIIDRPIDEAADVIETARAALSRRHLRIRDSDQELGRITFSAGLSDLADAAAATAEADKRLYAAKRCGRNQVSLVA